MTEAGRVALAARVFTLAVLASLAVTTGRGEALELVPLFVVAFLAQVVAALRVLPETTLAGAEGVVVAVLAMIAHPASQPVLPYLAIPVLIAGMATGLPGLLRVLGAEAVALLLSGLVLVGVPDSSLVADSVTWLAAGLGLGVLGRTVRPEVEDSRDPSYQHAVTLLGQLRALSSELTAGLDPVSLAEEAMATALDLVGGRQAGVFVRGDSGVVSALRYSPGAAPDQLGDVARWAAPAWADVAVPHGSAYAVPVRAERTVVAVLVVEGCTDAVDTRLLEQRLRPVALRLQAALLFDAIRASATSEERQRLAREVHDGVAQDVASLGYLVDGLLSGDEDDSSPQQADLLRLRGEVTRVVGELRHSVFELRNERGVGHGLGQSLSSFARHVGSHSDLTVHVRLDEASSRLRPEVEVELLRIAQEAMNNARRHSGATNLWVSCRVQPPLAEIEVLDDGRGLQGARPDSHGMRIMHERAERIGADLRVQSPAERHRGTRLLVRVGAADPGSGNHTETDVGTGVAPADLARARHRGDT